MNVINKVSLESLSDSISESVVSERADLGGVSLLRCRHKVMGDFIAVSDINGNCAWIKIG